MLARYVISAVIISSAGCSFESDQVHGAVAIQGQVVDFQTGAAVDAATSVTISGLVPAPQVDRKGAAFTIAGVLENSAFEVLAAAPLHRPTYSPVVVTTAGLDIEAPVVSEAFVTGLAGAFGVTPSAAKGVVLLHLVDAAGKPRAGVAATSFTIAVTDARGTIAGTLVPRFLDASRMAAVGSTTSSTSGWAVFFDVPVGLAGLNQGPSAPVTIAMPALTVAAGAVTVAEGRVSDGAPVLPSHVSFATQIVPIFEARGCVGCHAGGGIGKDLGGLTLDGSTKLIYKELVEERPNTRVRLAAPETSLILTMPSREDPPDTHPNVTFTGPRDPDYLKLLVWIREGALQN